MACKALGRLQAEREAAAVTKSKMISVKCDVAVRSVVYVRVFEDKYPRIILSYPLLFKGRLIFPSKHKYGRRRGLPP